MARARAPAPTIEPMSPEDWPAVALILGLGIEKGEATFETAVPSWDAWDGGHLRSPRLVARMEGEVVGWAALSPVSPRPAYAGVAEVSIYLHPSARGRGIGTRLLRELIARSEASGLWTLQAVMFPENEPSVRLHERCGFRVVGRRQRIGRLHGTWRDTLLLERRSPRIK